jgi:rfaE bifunctional protein kinase chain/domain
VICFFFDILINILAMIKNKKKLLEIIDAFAGKKIAVWGDYILDEYLFGYTRRISREAPVLILSYKNSRFSLGGAGNSLLNLKALGAEPIPVGVLGPNQSGNEVMRIIKNTGIFSDYLIQDNQYITPSKTRILAGEESTKKQQILRIDKESKVPNTEQIKNFLFSSLKECAKNTDAVLISDYNYLTVKKDLYSELLPDFKKWNIPVALDSRFRLMEFKKTTISTPNENEAKRALGIDIYDDFVSPEQAGTELLKRTGSDSLLLTRGSKGMILFQKNRKSYNINIYGTDEIVDVTGAGDTVISAITLAISTGADLEDAADIANYAAGIVVMKKGTGTVTTKELKEAIVSQN